MSDGEDADLRHMVFKKATELGAKLTGSCPVCRWEDHKIQNEEFWPKTIFPWAENVIVMGIPLPVPMVASTPSMIYQELYNTTNRLLDDMAYGMTTFLSDMGYRAMFFPRDGYFSIEALLDCPDAAFSHVLAAYYAGMGTIGDSHNLITREYGPRVRIVSVVTDAPVESDDMLESDLCIHCGLCLRGCPSHCLTDSGSHPYDMDRDACTRYHLDLRRERHWPCGACLRVCPIGDDLKAYRGSEIISDSGRTHCSGKGS